MEIPADATREEIIKAFCDEMRGLQDVIEFPMKHDFSLEQYASEAYDKRVMELMPVIGVS